MLSSMELLKKPFTSGCDSLCNAKWPPVKRGKAMVTWPGKYICALENIFVHCNILVHWETYLCTGKHICALKNIFVH